MLVVGVFAGATATGFQVNFETSTPVLIACLPMLVIHTIAVSLASNRLIHKIREKNLQLDALSRTDSLTGMHLRRHWQALASQTLQRRHADGVPASLLMIDIDRFKVSNDRHGHLAGDDVLRAVADAIRMHVREGDNVGRYGGDEFGMVLPGADAREAQVMADAILSQVRSIILPSAAGTRITVSIGIAEAADSHATLEEWIEAADSALYSAKHAGRDRMVIGRTFTQGVSIS